MSMHQDTERERRRGQELDISDISSKEGKLHNQDWRQIWRVCFLNYKNKTPV